MWKTGAPGTLTHHSTDEDKHGAHQRKLSCILAQTACSYQIKMAEETLVMLKGKRTNKTLVEIPTATSCMVLQIIKMACTYDENK